MASNEQIFKTHFKQNVLMILIPLKTYHTKALKNYDQWCLNVRKFSQNLLKCRPFDPAFWVRGCILATISVMKIHTFGYHCLSFFLSWSVPSVRLPTHRRNLRPHSGYGPTECSVEPMLTNHQWDLVTFPWGQFQRKCLRYLSLTWIWKLLIQDYSHIS